MFLRQFLQDQQYPLCVLLGGTGLREVDGQVHVVCALLRSNSGDSLVLPSLADAQMSYPSHLVSVVAYPKFSIGVLLACVVHLATELWLRRTRLMRLPARSDSQSRQDAC